MTIGNRISQLRKAKGFTQEYIAEQLDVSRQAVSKWEQDQTTPDTGNLIALAQLLDTSIEYIAIGKEKDNPPNQALMKQRELLQQKIERRQKAAYILVIAAPLLFFLTVGTFSFYSLVMLGVGVGLLYSVKNLKRDLEFLESDIK